MGGCMVWSRMVSSRMIGSRRLRCKWCAPITRFVLVTKFFKRQVLCKGRFWNIDLLTGNLFITPEGFHWKPSTVLTMLDVLIRTSSWDFEPSMLFFSQIFLQFIVPRTSLTPSYWRLQWRTDIHRDLTKIITWNFKKLGMEVQFVYLKLPPLTGFSMTPVFPAATSNGLAGACRAIGRGNKKLMN